MSRHVRVFGSAGGGGDCVDDVLSGWGGWLRGGRGLGLGLGDCR